MMLVIALVPFGLGPRPRWPRIGCDWDRPERRSGGQFAECGAGDFVGGVAEVVAVGARAGVEIDRLPAGVVGVVPVADDEAVVPHRCVPASRSGVPTGRGVHRTFSLSPK